MFKKDSQPSLHGLRLKFVKHYLQHPAQKRYSPFKVPSGISSTTSVLMFFDIRVRVERIGIFSHYSRMKQGLHRAELKWKLVVRINGLQHRRNYVLVLFFPPAF